MEPNDKLRSSAGDNLLHYTLRTPVLSCIAKLEIAGCAQYSSITKDPQHQEKLCGLLLRNRCRKKDANEVWCSQVMRSFSITLRHSKALTIQRSKALFQGDQLRCNVLKSGNETSKTVEETTHTTFRMDAVIYWDEECRCGIPGSRFGEGTVASYQLIKCHGTLTHILPANAKKHLHNHGVRTLIQNTMARKNWKFEHCMKSWLFVLHVENSCSFQVINP